MNGHIDSFLTAFPPQEGSAPADPGRVAALRTRIPRLLERLWLRQGWSSYGEGLLWFPDPALLADPLAEWLEEPDMAVGFARTSFGNLYCWQDDEVTFIDIHHGEAFSVLPDFGAFLSDYLPSVEALAEDLRAELHAAAQARVGSLQPSEMYAFVPALAFGGEEEAGAIEKVAFREHVAFLAGLHGG